MQIDCNKTWRIMNITKLSGSEDIRPSAKERIGCTGYFDADEPPREDCPMRFYYLKDNKGEIISKSLRTTTVTDMEYYEFDCRTEIPDYIIIKTKNYIYTLEEVIDA